MGWYVRRGAGGGGERSGVGRKLEERRRRDGERKKALYLWRTVGQNKNVSVGEWEEILWLHTALAYSNQKKKRNLKRVLLAKVSG